MDLPGDPRVPEGSTYDRVAIMNAVTEFYELLVTLSYVEREHLHYPPEEGWATVTRESIIDEFEQTEEVYLLLKHLPYLDHSKWKYYIKEWTYPCDWRSDALDDTELTRLERNYPQMDWLPDLPAWTIPLTRQSEPQYGSFAILDTTDGTITQMGCDVCTTELHNKDYAVDDPRAWRNHAQNQYHRADLTQPAVTYFRKLYEKYHSLEWVANRSENYCTEILVFPDGQGHSEKDIWLKKVRMPIPSEDRLG